jgi:[acyl-carrier-protein] S-malonyltransferase
LSAGRVADLALLFPGQGSQFVGMGKDLAEAYPMARQTFEEADRVLGLPLSKIAWEGPAEALTQTENAQPAILVHSVAVWRVVAARLAVRVAVAAGHSLGEFSAYVAAAAIPFADAVRLVRRRGELMAGSGRERPGTMAAVLGLDDALVRQACAEVSENGGGTVVAANFNAPGQVVISGEAAAVERAGAVAKEKGAKRVVPLPVSGAFHSPLMGVAEPGLAEALEKVPFGRLAFPILSNVTAEPVTDGRAAKDLLLRQLTSPVRFSEGVQRMRRDKVGVFAEIGPGGVLAGLVKRIDRDARTVTLGTAAEVSTFLESGEGEASG